MTARTKSTATIVLLLGGGVAFSSGLVLLFAFHVGHGCLRHEALGLSRLAWQNLHRLGAVVALGAVWVHAIANWGGIRRRSLRILRGKPMRSDLHEVAVYTGNTVVLLTGFVAWLVVGGSLPILGPALLEPVASTRHPWIDVHHLVGMLALVLTTNHVRRRWHALAVLLRRAQARPGTVVPRRAGQRRLAGERHEA
jgi:hypothetical protein